MGCLKITSREHYVLRKHSLFEVERNGNVIDGKEGKNLDWKVRMRM